MAFRGIYLPYVFSRPDLICLDVDAKGFLELCVVLTGTFKGNAWVIFSWI
jgi:hypothetical protein